MPDMVNLSPAELVTALGLDAAPADAPVDGGGLAALMERYPDGC
jgi:hypothetical protein